MREQMDLTERKLGREDKFAGRIVTVHVDTVELPGGRTATREVVDHPGGVAVLALDDDNNVLAVTQYRYPFGRTTLEIPAGKLDHPGEDPYAAGLRELEEETGAVPGRYESLGRILPSPGCYGEILHLYLARDLRMAAQHLDEDEFLNVERIPFAEMVRRCLSGEIEDAKTVAAVLKGKILLNL
ncbi:NUDIX hydrolase [uncultured Oscillibacter sp.]|uniref:NUDIX hydrolase n=1 Tax=uncultured Oscillibacter sp. TaxID=876091 RepID=UPI002602DF17|nr:NUDIX hydrolase [uncultured Oscillibacter sp.]